MGDNRWMAYPKTERFTVIGEAVDEGKPYVIVRIDGATQDEVNRGEGVDGIYNYMKKLQPLLRFDGYDGAVLKGGKT